MSKGQQPIVGGGFKKVLYTLNTVRRIGVQNSAKALTAKNTCKACALGMGGQHGGMTNELDEFPSVCNKSIQAQSTDIQGPIPAEIFSHSLDELRELSAKEIENLGRLGFPVYKEAGDNRFKALSWDQAMALAVERFKKASPNKTFFYSSGRSSNEAAFVLQLMARMYGSSHINNCSYYCHQATGVGLTNSIGTGTATVELEDLKSCDLVFLIGANPASNHPRLIHQLKGCRDRGGDVVVINPAKESGLVKFAVPKEAKSLITGGDWIASEYLQPNIGSDIALFTGIGKALVEISGIDEAFIRAHTEGFAAYLTDLENTPWEQIEKISGITHPEIMKVAERYKASEKTVFAWGMGMTHHRHGVDNVEAIANLALLRGMIGKVGAGLLPLRGHSNVQGIGTMGVKPVLTEEVFSHLEKVFDITLSRDKGMDTLSCLQSAGRGEIEAALIMGGNLYAGSPDTAWAGKALDSIGFKMFLTTTLNQGHVHGVDNSECLILPVTARDEEWEKTTQESMFNFVRLSDGGIQRLENVRPEMEILVDLATGVMPDSPVDFSAFKSHETVRKAIAKTIPGMDGLADIDVAKKEFHIKNRIKHTPEFNTANGKGYFSVHPLKAAESTADEFQLMTVRSEGQFNSIVYEENDSYRNIPHRWSVMMSPEDMAKYQLNNADQIDLKSDVGEMKAVSVFAFDLPPGNLMAYYPEANILVNQEVDERSRTPAFKSVTVQVSI